MPAQLTSHVLMIRPVNFGYNEETAVNNHFQYLNEGLDPIEIQENALQEFDGFVAKLRSFGVSVTVIEDTQKPPTPDSIFPNNWVSFHADGRTVLYPMFAQNRRAERRFDILKSLNRNNSQVLDMSEHESENCFLEGTGSMVLDRNIMVAYACLSERTNQDLFHSWAADMSYSICDFHATQIVKGIETPIYHTNVMMSIGEDFAIICLDMIRNLKERNQVLSSLKSTNHKIIEITENQVNHFAGNMLQLRNEIDEKFLVMSTQAFASLSDTQIASLELSSTIIHSRLDTIENFGGGSARCMLAELY